MVLSRPPQVRIEMLKEGLAEYSHGKTCSRDVLAV